MYLLDTNICIYWGKGDREIERQYQRAGSHQIAISAVTTAELFYGAYKSADPEKNLAALERLSRRVTILSSLDRVDRIFGEIKAGLERRGAPLEDSDIFIAAFALHYEATLITNNIQDFKRIKNLRLDNWRSPHA